MMTEVYLKSLIKKIIINIKKQFTGCDDLIKYIMKRLEAKEVLSLGHQ